MTRGATCSSTPASRSASVSTARPISTTRAAAPAPAPEPTPAARRGLALMRRRGVPMHAICVVTHASLARPDELVDFFADEGITDQGLCIEEIEGANHTSTLEVADVEQRFWPFFKRAFDQSVRRGVLLRKARATLAMLPRRPAPAWPGPVWPGNDQNTPFADVTIGWHCAIHTFSPELARLKHPVIGDMALGNVHADTLAGIFASPRFRALWAEVSEGVEAVPAHDSISRSIRAPRAGGDPPAYNGLQSFAILVFLRDPKSRQYASS